MTAPLAIVEAHDGGLVTISLRDEIDLANAPAIRDEIIRTLPNHVRGAVLDLSTVSFIDSAGIRLLFDVARATQAHGQSLRLAVAEGSLAHEALVTVAIAEVVPVDPDPVTALRQLRAEAR